MNSCYYHSWENKIANSFSILFFYPFNSEAGGSGKSCQVGWQNFHFVALAPLRSWPSVWVSGEWPLSSLLERMAQMSSSASSPSLAQADLPLRGTDPCAVEVPRGKEGLLFLELPIVVEPARVSAGVLPSDLMIVEALWFSFL